jgi:hypothetical protein
MLGMKDLSSIHAFPQSQSLLKRHEIEKLNLLTNPDIHQNVLAMLRRISGATEERLAFVVVVVVHAGPFAGRFED